MGIRISMSLLFYKYMNKKHNQIIRRIRKQEKQMELSKNNILFQLVIAKW